MIDKTIQEKYRRGSSLFPPALILRRSNRHTLNVFEDWLQCSFLCFHFS